MKKILLTDANTYAALSIARSLAKKGFEIIAGGESITDMTFYSKSVLNKFIYTSPRKSVERFLYDIKEAVNNFSPDLLIPVADKTLIVISEHRDSLRVNTFLPPEQSIKLAINKYETLKMAEGLGINTPKTIPVDKTYCKPNFLSGKGINFPVAMKACCSESIIGDKVVGGGNTIYSNSEEELISKLNNLQVKFHKILLQEFIRGTIIGISGIFKDGSPVALFAHKRIRQTRPIGGPSALAESITINDNLKHQTLSLIKTLNWSGPAMVEFKVGKNGKIYLLEINGRFWGSLPLPVLAGMDIPYIFLKSTDNIPIEPLEKSYQTGIKGRYLWGDFLNLLLRLKGIPEWWPDPIPSRICALKDFSASFFDKTTVYLDFQLNDIKPFLIRPVSLFCENLRG